MSQPSRALYIFLKLSKIPTDFHPIALRSGMFYIIPLKRDYIDRSH